MNELSAGDLYDILLSLVEIMNSNVEMWLSATFATLVAFHFIGEKLTKELYWIATIMYLLASGFFLLRHLNAGSAIQQTFEMIESRNVPVLPQLPEYVSMGFFVLYFTGTSCCLWYMRRCYRQSI